MESPVFFTIEEPKCSCGGDFSLQAPHERVSIVIIACSDPVIAMTLAVQSKRNDVDSDSHHPANIFVAELTVTESESWPERLRLIGEIMIRDCFAITDRWLEDAIAAQPSANKDHRDVVRDELPYFLRSMGQRLLRGPDSNIPAPDNIAWSHGEQRWRVGWSLSEVVRDYQILRKTVHRYFDEQLETPVTRDESLIVDDAIDDAILISVNAFKTSSAAELSAVNQSLEKRVRERTLQLRQIASELVQAEQKERERLSEILHDHHQQLLMAIRLRLKRLSCPSGEQETLRAEIDNLLAEAIVSSKTLSAELSPPFLEEESLERILEWLADWMEEQHGLKTAVTIEGELPHELSAKARISLYHAVREALFNTVKHSGNDSATMTVSVKPPGTLSVLIEDDGNGVDPKLLEDFRNLPGGLRRVRQRLRMFDGAIKVSNRPQGGLAVLLTIPVDGDSGAGDAPPNLS